MADLYGTAVSDRPNVQNVIKTDFAMSLRFLQQLTLSGVAVMDLSAFSKLTKLKSLCLHDVMVSTCVSDDQIEKMSELFAYLDRIALSNVPICFLTALNRSRILPFEVFLSVSIRKCSGDYFGLYESLFSRNTKFLLQLFLFKDKRKESEHHANLQHLLKVASSRIKMLEIHARFEPLPMTFCMLFHDLTSVTSLKVGGATLLLQDGDLVALARMTPNLKILHLGQSCLLLAEDYRSISGYWRDLEEISLKRSAISGANLKALLRNGRFHRIFLEKCGEVDHKRKDLALDCSILDFVCEFCPLLEVLEVKHCRIYATDQILERLIDLPNLKRLGLEGRNVDLTARFVDLLRARCFASEIMFAGSIGKWRNQFNVCQKFSFCKNPAVCDNAVIGLICCPFCGTQSIVD